ncbi:hypothetical protein L3Q82_000825 [Scortum barcoo]|uniref:Uncharacterized protein n=1 Tax=Scortum barcoo TaxID=214431 RepID=A0ACB8WDM9_9TELE|nr:hypothetical protein L3Q82_000825 [Scortum barcoo]
MHQKQTFFSLDHNETDACDVKSFHETFFVLKCSHMLKDVVLSLRGDATKCKPKSLSKPKFTEEETTSEVPFPEKKKRRITIQDSSTMIKRIVAAGPQVGRTSDLTSTETLPKERTEPRTVTKIWIIGSSYILKGKRAANQCYGKGLGLNANVKWFGKGSMGWNGVLPCFYKELSKESPPDILVIHAGGNDLGLRSVKELSTAMKKDLMRIHAQFPAMKIVYSCINERKVWQYGRPAKTNQDRKIINTWMKKAA